MRQNSLPTPLSSELISSLGGVTLYTVTSAWKIFEARVRIHEQRDSFETEYAQQAEQNLSRETCLLVALHRMHRMHLATGPLVSGCTRERTVQTHVYYLPWLVEAPATRLTILFSPSLTVLRWPPRKLQTARPLVRANRFQPCCVSRFTIFFFFFFYGTLILSGTSVSKIIYFYFDTTPLRTFLFFF